MTGQLWFHFASAILLTVVISNVIVSWYRRAVIRSMRTAGSGPANLAPAFEQELPALRQRIAAGARDYDAGEASRLLRRRAMVVYGFGGIVASVVMTVLYLVVLGDELLLIRTFTIFYVFCWPVVLTLSFFFGLSRGRELLFVAAYVGAGALMVAILSAVIELGRPDIVPLQNAVAFLQFAPIQALPPFLVILIMSGARIRSVAPLVLAGLLVFSFGNFAAGSAMVTALDFGAVRDALLSLGAYGGYNAWYLLAALPIGYACWQGLRWLSGLYERKIFSDAQLLVDAWWFIVVLIFSVFLVIDFGWVGLPLGLCAFAAYRIAVEAALAHWSLGETWLDNRRLLLLRVFGFQRRTERLFDTVAQRWRWLGSIKIIAGADLATRLIGPGDLISFVGGRLHQLFLRRDMVSLGRLSELDEARDPDGRYRVNKVYCHDDSWQPALRGLLSMSDIVLMDLRGFSDKNQGCLFELQQLVDQNRTPRTVFVVDNATDTKLLETVLAEQMAARYGASERGAMSLNLVFAGSSSAADANRVYRALALLAA